MFRFDWLLIWRCLLNIQVRLSSRQIDVCLDFRKDAGDMCESSAYSSSLDLELATTKFLFPGRRSQK